MNKNDINVNKGRREALGTIGGLGIGAMLGCGVGSVALYGQSKRKGLIGKIESQILWEGREPGEPTWFHPRACMVGEDNERYAMMTLQSITGSDVFGHVHWTVSKDLGRTWSEPKKIPSLGRKESLGMMEGVCDVVPAYHAKTKTVLAVGHNVYYKGGKLARPQGPRWPMYVVWDGERWSKVKRLEWEDGRGSSGIYTCGCSERVMLENGEMLVALSFNRSRGVARSVSVTRCTFDGENMMIKESGNVLDLKVKRGLLEPSLAAWGGRYYMTIRAEDGKGYVSVSDDGKTWGEIKAWAWEDGKTLGMSTTQQHWLRHSKGLFLVYTREDAQNKNVFRWRAPLWIAQVDTKKMCLMKETERVVLPLVGDGIKHPKHVARMGNFHTTEVNEDVAWVTAGETLPHDGWKGNTLLGRIHWNEKNALV